MEGVSDAAFAEATKGAILTREQYRAVKGYNKRQLELWAATLYRNGIDDMAKAMAEKAEEKAKEQAEAEEEVKADWEDVLKLIAEVEGVTAEMVQGIDRKLRAAY